MRDKQNHAHIKYKYLFYLPKKVQLSFGSAPDAKKSIGFKFKNSNTSLLVLSHCKSCFSSSFFFFVLSFTGTAIK